MKKILVGGLLTIIALLAFYLVMPKYRFFAHGRTRCNQVTGKVEHWIDKYNGWVKLGKESLPESKFESEEDFGFVPENTKE